MRLKKFNRFPLNAKFSGLSGLSALVPNYAENHKVPFINNKINTRYVKKNILNSAVVKKKFRKR